MNLIPTCCSDCKPIDSGDVKIIYMHAEGDGEQVLELFRRPVDKFLRELMADMCLARCQHFGFQEYKDPRGNRLFAGHLNGSSSISDMISGFKLCSSGGEIIMTVRP
jgi:hypothetical protein